MELARIDDDHCPHCADRFEIVFVKFRFAHIPPMVVVCPNCAYTVNWGTPPCGSAVESGRSKHWIKIKNRKHQAFARVQEAHGSRAG